MVNSLQYETTKNIRWRLTGGNSPSLIVGIWVHGQSFSLTKYDCEYRAQQADISARWDDLQVDFSIFPLRSFLFANLAKTKSAVMLSFCRSATCRCSLSEVYSHSVVTPAHHSTFGSKKGFIIGWFMLLNGTSPTHGLGSP